jgi:hypothetical protein
MAQCDGRSTRGAPNVSVSQVCRIRRLRHLRWRSFHAPALLSPPAGNDGRGPGTRDATTQRGATPGAPVFHRDRFVACDGLALPARPDRDARVVRIARPGEAVRIHSGTPGQDVLGDRARYLLVDGAWAWTSARCLANAGPPPRSC